MIERPFGDGALRLTRGDITLEETDAIVNAANSTLLGGGGVDGAIHRAGGPEILAACKVLRERQGECPTGEAVCTTAGKLKARYVIHTVGPVWRGGDHGEDDLLLSCYRNSLRLAFENQVRRISFPSISTGVYRFPIARAAPLALGAVRDALLERKIDSATFVLFSAPDLDVYRRALDEL